MATLVLSAAGAAIGAGFGGAVLGLSGAVIGRAIGATLGRAIDQRILGAGSEPVDIGRIDRLRLTGAGEGDRLSASVARHLKRYFDLHGGQLPPPGVYQRILREVELPLIEIALDASAGNQAKCADLLGINRNTLRKKITDLDIRVTRRRKLM